MQGGVDRSLRSYVIDWVVIAAKVLDRYYRRRAFLCIALYDPLELGTSRGETH